MLAKLEMILNTIMLIAVTTIATATAAVVVVLITVIDHHLFDLLWFYLCYFSYSA